MDLAAYTAPGGSYPAFLNISEAEGGEVAVTVRAPAETREGVFVCATKADAGKPGRCFPGDANCNNYCNMAPAKGPMADSPKACTHVDAGAMASARFPRAEAIKVLEEALAKLKSGGT